MSQRGISAIRRRCVALCAAMILATGCGDSSKGKQAASAPIPSASLASNCAQRDAPRDWVASPAIDPSETSIDAGLRIVSLSPQGTELCCSLGARDRLVGRTQFCQYPAGIEAVPVVGTLADLNIETVMALSPSFVLVSGEARDLRAKLSPTSLEVVSIPDATLDDVYAAARRVGQRIGRSKTAEQLCRAIRDDLARIAARVNLRNQSILFLTDSMPDPPTAPQAAGRGSFYGELLRMAGQDNIVPTDAKPFAPVSLECIADPANEPDRIIEIDWRLPDGVHRRAVENSGWRELRGMRAVRDGRVYAIGGARSLRLGPRITMLFRDLCEALDDVAETNGKPR